MTYLELVQKTWQLLGHEDDEILSITDNEGVKGDVIDAINTAWTDIQRERAKHFKHLRGIETFVTVANQQAYVIGTDCFTGTGASPASTTFGEWKTDMILYDGIPLNYVSYDYFKTTPPGTDKYKITFNSGSTAISIGDTITEDVTGATGTATEIVVETGTWAGGDAAGYILIDNQVGTFTVGNDVNTGIATIASVSAPSRNKPYIFTIDPVNDSILLNEPNKPYAIVAHYYKAFNEMSIASDTPTGLDSRFHMLIVYTALVDLGVHFGAGEITDRYETKRAHALGQLLRTENPQKDVKLRPVA